jgi:hypothetical protein
MKRTNNALVGVTFKTEQSKSFLTIALPKKNKFKDCFTFDSALTRIIETNQNRFHLFIN